MEEESKPKKVVKRKPKKPKTFKKRMYIPAFGFVDQGDEASKEAYEAWAKWSKVDIEDYLE